MLTSLASLWLPIILSGVALFFASWAAWMLSPHHKGEWKALPDEDGVMNALRQFNLPPGQYNFPHACDPNAMKTEEYKRRITAGPIGFLTVWKASPNMGVNMLCTVLFFLVANFVIAYLAAMVIPPGEERWKVFRFVGTAGVHLRHGQYPQRHLVRPQNGGGYHRRNRLWHYYRRDLRATLA